MSMYKSFDCVTVVVVTYGNRWCYLSRVLRFLEDDDLVKNVLVVDNASTNDISSLCASTELNKPTIIRMEYNTGSAGGFSVGLKHAYKMSCQYILLLDDDVLPRKGSLSQLLSTYHEVNENSPVELLALMAFRRSQFGEKTIPARPFFLGKHHFFGLNVFNFYQRHFLNCKKKSITNPTPEVINRLGGAAYAGLFITKDIIKRIGYPNKDFVVYLDDVEYTSRILKNDGEIWLDINAEFDDICENYSMGVVSLPFLGYLLSDSEVKVYYLVRNRTFICRYVHESKSIFFLFNFCVFVSIITIIGVFLLKFKRLTVIFRGLNHGWNGKLGLNPKYQLS